MYLLYDILHSSAPPTGLYFELSGVIYNVGDFVLISDIGPQPADRSNCGSTSVCVTTNVNTACCRRADNSGMTNLTAGAVGEWRYPNSTLVPRPSGNVVDFARVGYTHQVRLARSVSDSPTPLGVYTCEVPHPSGVTVTGTITLIEQGMKVANKSLIVPYPMKQVCYIFFVSALKCRDTVLRWTYFGPGFFYLDDLLALLDEFSRKNGCAGG